MASLRARPRLAARTQAPMCSRAEAGARAGCLCTGPAISVGPAAVGLAALAKTQGKNPCALPATAPAAGVWKLVHDTVMFLGPFLLELLLKHLQAHGSGASTHALRCRSRAEAASGAANRRHGRCCSPRPSWMPNPQPTSCWSNPPHTNPNQPTLLTTLQRWWDWAWQRAWRQPASSRR